MDYTVIMLVLYVLVLWVLIGFVFHRGYKEWRANVANRPSSSDARIMDRRQSRVEGDRDSYEHQITFEFSGKQREFTVSREQYEAVRIGQEGTIRLIGDRFDTFEPKSDTEQADEIRRRMMK